MKADPFWSGVFPEDLHWDLYPFKSYTDLYPSSTNWANTPALRHQATNPPPRPALTATEGDVDALRRHYPDADPADPPWDDVRADLLVAGVSPELIKQLESRDAIKMLDRLKPSGSASPQQRLKVDVRKLHVILDGEPFSVSPDAAALFTALAGSNGDRVPAKDYSSKPGRLYNALPPELQAIIDRSNNGYRLCLDRVPNTGRKMS